MSEPAPGRRRHRGAQGQAAVELALLLPLLAMMALFLAQLALTARDQIMVTHSAREAARAVAVGEDASAAGRASLARRAALGAARLDPQRLQVRVDELATGDVSVRVEYRSPVRFAALAALVDELAVSGEAVMRDER